MAIPGWTRTESPFHAGELAIQGRMGTQAKMDRQGRQMIREYLPEQFRQFFPQLPYIIVGTVDVTGSPWASILVGEPGFLSSPDDRTLQIAAKPLFGDPFTNTLAEGIDIGLLGIELHTRRRNRVNGTLTLPCLKARGFLLHPSSLGLFLTPCLDTSTSTHGLPDRVWNDLTNSFSLSYTLVARS